MLKILIFTISFNLFATDFFYENGKKIEITKIQNLRSLDCCNGIYIYKTKSGKILKFKKEIVTRLKKGINAKDFFMKMDIHDYSKVSTNTFLIKPTQQQDIFILLQKLYESGKTIYAIPNKILKYKKR